MTRRLRPPVPVQIRCHSDGSPASLRRGGRERAITHVAASWVRPSLWWQDEQEMAPRYGGERPLSPLLGRGLKEGDVGDEGFYGERTYYRLVVDDIQILEVFTTRRGAWYLERIVD